MGYKSCKGGCARINGQSHIPRKRWNAEFFEKHQKNRTNRETLFIEGLELNDIQRGLHDAFMQDSEVSGASWEVEKVQKFFREAGTIPNAKVWIDLRVREGFEGNEVRSRWLVSSDLVETMEQQVCLTRYHFSVGSLKPLAVQRSVRVTWLPETSQLYAVSDPKSH
jgi:hypothetical protein